jgi:hypothetical protein
MGRTSSRLRKGLPRWLWTFFWDVDPKALDPVEYRDFILGRLLARGDWRAWKWVRRHWTEEELREFLLRTRGRGIDEPERLTFYALMLGIPYETVRGWLRDRQDPWSRRHEILRARDGSGSRRAEVAGVGAFRRRLAEHLRRVRTRREPLFIARRGRIVAAVIPVGADDVEAVEAFCDAIRWLNPPPGSGRS